jgi:hypothetical protein
MFWVLLVFLSGTSGCAEEFPEERTVLDLPGMRVPPAWLRSGKTPVPGQLILLGGRILKKYPEPGGCLFLVGALPLTGKAPGSDVPGKVRFSKKDAFLLSVSSLRLAGSPVKEGPKSRRISFVGSGRMTSPIVPGDLVTVLGEVRGWIRMDAGSSERKSLLVVRGWYLERW